MLYGSAHAHYPPPRNAIDHKIAIYPNLADHLKNKREEMYVLMNESGEVCVREKNALAQIDNYIKKRFKELDSEIYRIFEEITSQSIANKLTTFTTGVWVL